eukprot:sb/3476335/
MYLQKERVSICTNIKVTQGQRGIHLWNCLRVVPDVVQKRCCTNQRQSPYQYHGYDPVSSVEIHHLHGVVTSQDPVDGYHHSEKEPDGREECDEISIDPTPSQSKHPSPGDMGHGAWDE